MSRETAAAAPPDSMRATSAAGASGARSPLRTILGLALVAPAGLVWLLALALPTLRTLTMSFSSGTPLGEGDFVGLDNYRRLFDDPLFGTALGNTLALIGERLVIVAVVPPLLALALNEFGRALRLPVRLLFTLPLALYAPVFYALIWGLLLDPRSGPFGDRALLVSRTEARPTLFLIDALATFGLACAVGLIVYGIALRGAGSGAPTPRRVRGPLLVSWLVTVLATIALALQSFAPTYALTGGGPANTTQNLALLQYTHGFAFLRTGFAAAIASPTLVVLALLGLAAGLLVVLTGLRLETVPRGRPAGLLDRAEKPLALLVLVVVLLGSLAFWAFDLYPWLWNWRNSPGAYDEVGGVLQVGQVALNTVLPVAASVLLVQLPVAYLAALGIGALRPLGRRSEWLLLPFSPWLFVTIGPLSLAAFERLQDAALLNTVVGLTPPLVLNVPLLFVLTLFFKGQARHWQAARAQGQPASGAFVPFVRTVLLPSLPLAILLATVALVVGMQDLLWPLIVAARQEVWTIPVALLQLARGQAADGPVISAAVTEFELPLFLGFFLVLALFQLFFLDRLALGTPASEDQRACCPTMGGQQADGVAQFSSRRRAS